MAENEKVEQKEPFSWFGGLLGRMTNKEEDSDYDPNEKLQSPDDFLKTSDEIEKKYGFSFGTKSYKAIVDRFKRFSEVSSVSQTNKRADLYIKGSMLMKPASIYLSYLSAMSHLSAVSVFEEWQKMALSLALSIMGELIFSKESSAIFNREEVPATRITGAVLGSALAYVFIQFHIAYIEQEVAHADITNTAKVIEHEASSPKLTQLQKQLEIVQNSIVNEESLISSKNNNATSQKAIYKNQMDAYLTKAKMYQNLVNIATKKKHKNIFVNGAYKRVATVTSYANSQRKMAGEIADKIAKIEFYSSPRLESLNQKEADILGQISSEQTLLIAKKNETSSDGLGILKILLILVEIMSKMDLYGYFLLRANIKKEIIQKVSKIIDEYSSLSQIQGIIDQLSRQGSLILKGVAESVKGINDQIGTINQTNIMSTSSILTSHDRLLIELKHEMDRNRGQNQLAPSVTANYAPTGDKEADITGENTQSRTEAQKREIEDVLTSFTKSQGHNYKVILSDRVKVGDINGDIIRLNDSLSDDDLRKALIHEFGHIESQTNRHDEKYHQGLKKAKEKMKQNPPPQKPMIAVIDPNRRWNIVQKFLNEDFNFKLLPFEKDLFRSFGIWDDKFDRFDNQSINHASFYEALHHGQQSH